MRFTNQTIKAAAIVMLFAAGCKKKQEPANINNNNTGTGSNPAITTPTTTGQTGAYTSMTDIFTLLAPQAKTVSFDVGTGSSFYGISGTRYIFLPNCFRDATGAKVTGTVQVTATEYLKKSDMIFGCVLPVSNGAPLLSGGEINVTATQAGKEIFINPALPFEARIPQSGTTDTNMIHFRGRPTTGNIQSKINWLPMIDTGKLWATTHGKDTLGILSDSMHFCNADKFLINPNYQNFKVSIATAGVSLEGISIYAYTLFDNLNGCWALGNYSGGAFNENHVPDIPVHFVAFCLVNGRFYCGITAATPKNGQTYTVSMAEADPAAFKAKITALQ